MKRIFRKEEIYKGPLLEQAPDLVLVGDKGFNLKATMKTNELFSKGGLQVNTRKKTPSFY